MTIQENIPLAPYTTLKIGGPARYFARIETEEALLQALAFARLQSIPTYILGGGSNLVVADTGYPGLVLHLALGTTISLQPDGNRLAGPVDAGVDWDLFVRHSCIAQVSGAECLAGIPGLVGGSPIQNIGAYGQEVADIITHVRAFDRERQEFVSLTHAQCAFRYRQSLFNGTARGRYIVTRLFFSFALQSRPQLAYADLASLRGTNPTPLDVYHAVREIRARKGMLIDPHLDDPDTRSAGSFFKNPIVPLDALDRVARRLGIPIAEIKHWPVQSHPEATDPGGTVPAPSTGQTKLPAAWLIERAGFPKGFRLGPVGISSKHTLALVNRTGTATCAELLALRDHIIAGVDEAFGITLEQEPVYLS